MEDNQSIPTPPPGFKVIDQPNLGAQPGAASDSPPPGFELVEDKYGTTGQQAIAGLEGAAQGMIGPLAPMAERALGVKPEAIRSRAEVNPWTKGLGEAAGLGAGAITGTGEAALLGKVGMAAKTAAGLGEASMAARVGSSAVQQAAEMAILQGSDETAKMVYQDPKATAQTAIANIGLASALGGVGGAAFTGVISPLWKATLGPKVEAGLSALVNHVGGAEATTDAINKAADLEARTGVPLPPEIKAVVNDLPGARAIHSDLSQNDMRAGQAYQKILQGVEEGAGAKVVESLGKNVEDLGSLPKENRYATGQELGDSLHQSLSPTAEALNSEYENTANSFKSNPNSINILRGMDESLSKKAMEEGWPKAIDKDNMNLINKVREALPEQANINDLKLAITNLDRKWDAPDFKAAMAAKKILSKGMEDSIIEHMGPEAAVGYNQLRNNYADFMNHLEDLDTHLHVGKWGGPKTFLDALKERSETKGEQLLQNFTGKNNAHLLDTLKDHPEVLARIKDHYVNDLLRDSTKNMYPGQMIKANALVKDISNMSPQVQGLIASPEQHATIQANMELLNSLKDPTHNWSNTARTIAKQSHGALSPISLLAMLMGHGDAGLLSYLGTLGFSEAKPAMKLAMMRFLGSSQPIKAEGFKSMVSLIDNTYKGQNTINKAVENVFKPGIKVLTDSQMPSAKEIMKLDRMIASNDKNDNKQITDNAIHSAPAGHYMPEHQMAIAQSQAQASQYLQSIKPQGFKPSPLDKEIPPTPAQEARYQRALTIAQQPAIVMQRIKDGTLLPSDVVDLKSMYPAVYDSMSNAVMSNITNKQADESLISYNTRIGLSLFLGQPLDSSMAPMSIMSAQPIPQQPQQQKPARKPSSNTKDLSKGPKAYMTHDQASEAHKNEKE